jgi:LacI family transcriptional regulator
VHTLPDRRVDGLILARAAASDPALIRSLKEEKAPVVLLDRIFAELPFDQVGAENRDSMRRLLTHLADAGRRRFIVVAGDTRVPALRERLEGLGDVVRDSGLAEAEQTVVGGTDDARLREELTAVVAAGRHDSLIAASTPLAVLCLEVMQSLGVDIPGDLAFATFDGFTNPDLFRPRITTVRQPAFDMGAAAVGLLADRLDSPGSSPRTVRLQQSIEFRESTEGARTPGP